MPTRATAWCGIVRRGAASAVTWRTAQMVLPSTPGVDFAVSLDSAAPGSVSGRSGVGRST
ncbi:hypothetical protein ACFTY7_33910 [Streptomyces sp. NPDC057062]|uniref:hypothetical protein n=1 Tax=Streptomyces sp. NPDC057062 TaxID=3346011 RepID=UPI003630F5DC